MKKEEVPKYSGKDVSLVDKTGKVYATCRLVRALYTEMKLGKEEWLLEISHGLSFVHLGVDYAVLVLTDELIEKLEAKGPRLVLTIDLPYRKTHASNVTGSQGDKAVLGKDKAARLARGHRIDQRLAARGDRDRRHMLPVQRVSTSLDSR